MNKFILPIPMEPPKRAGREVVRISSDSKILVDEMAFKTRLTASEIVSRCVEFAYGWLEYEPLKQPVKRNDS